MAERPEGRLARWSRLKTQGEDRAEDTEGVPDEASPADGDVPRHLPKGFEDLPDASMLPGGVQNRTFVPPMAPLADVEVVDKDTPAYQAPPPEALAMLNGQINTSEALAEEEREWKLTPEEQAAVDELPPLESLSKESDFTPFLADNIPEFIRNRALRILWRSDPLFGFQDGLDDYAENFRVIDKLIDAATDSSYRPGKGYNLPDDDDLEDGTEVEGDDTVTDAETARSKEQSQGLVEADEPPEDGPISEENDFPPESDLKAKDVS